MKKVADPHLYDGPLCDKNLIEQTQGTDLPSVPQIIKFSLTQPFRIANNTIQETQMRLSKRHPHGGTILQAGQNLCIETSLEHTRTVK